MYIYICIYADICIYIYMSVYYIWLYVDKYICSNIYIYGYVYIIFIYTSIYKMYTYIYSCGVSDFCFLGVAISWIALANAAAVGKPPDPSLSLSCDTHILLGTTCEVWLM